MESWPLTLPQVPAGAVGDRGQAGLLAPEQALGQTRTRTYPERQVSLAFSQLTAAQFQAFRQWWDGALNRCLPFTAPWLAAAGYTHHFCRFTADAPWELVTSGVLFDLHISVEITATVPVDGDGAIAYGRDGWL